MTKTYYTNLITCICLFFSLISYAQTKNEKEERINKEDFPINALEVIDHIPAHAKRLRFYKETDGEKQSFEAKFKLNKLRYSVEFNTNGELEDIEVKTKFGAISKPLSNNILSYLKNNHDKHRIIKIQKQFLFNNTLSPKDFFKTIINNNTDLKPRFEIIAEVKDGKTRTIKEFTFDNKGDFVEARIVNPNSYEHVLY